MEKEYFAVIDTETTVSNAVMSIGIVISDSETFEIIKSLYYVIDPFYHEPSMYSSVLFLKDIGNITQVLSLKETAKSIRKELKENYVKKIFAYNAKFDYNLLPYLHDFAWFDIMKLAANKKFNHCITPDMETFSTGKLKRNYGVEPILRMLSNNSRYHEFHNAIKDSQDELKIMKLLGLSLDAYKFGYLVESNRPISEEINERVEMLDDHIYSKPKVIHKESIINDDLKTNYVESFDAPKKSDFNAPVNDGKSNSHIAGLIISILVFILVVIFLLTLIF